MSKLEAPEGAHAPTTSGRLAFEVGASHLHPGRFFSAADAAACHPRPARGRTRKGPRLKLVPPQWLAIFDRAASNNARKDASKHLQNLLPETSPLDIKEAGVAFPGYQPPPAARAAALGTGTRVVDGPLYGTEEPRRQALGFKLPSNARAANTSKHLLAGALAAVVARTVVAPLERLKLEYIVRGAKGPLAATFLRVLRREGIGGFWRGNMVNLLRTAPFKAINYASFDTYRKQLLKVRAGGEISNPERLACGAAAGVTSTVLCFPLDTVRTRMIAQGGSLAFSDLGRVGLTLVAAEGPLSLYRGLLPAIVSMAPSGAVFYGTYDLLRTSFLRSPAGKRHLQQKDAQERLQRAAEDRGGQRPAWDRRRHMEVGALRTLLYGALSGACAEATTYPFEVVRKQMQVQGRCQGSALLGAIRAVAARGGPAAFYAGLLPSTLQVLPSAALSYFVYEFLKANLKVE